MPLDATNKVPIDSAFLARIEREARTPLARFVAQVLGTNRSLIAQGAYFAWDPLAAVALVHPEILRTRCLAIGVAQEPHEAGRIIDLQGELQGRTAAASAECVRGRGRRRASVLPDFPGRARNGNAAAIAARDGFQLPGARLTAARHGALFACKIARRDHADIHVEVAVDRH